MSQLQLKIEVFRNLDTTRSRLRDIYSRDTKPGLDDYYRLYVDPLLDPTLAPANEAEVAALERVGTVCRKWTNLLRASARFSLAGNRVLTRRLGDFKLAVEELNDQMEQLSTVPALELKRRLPMPEIDGPPSKAVLLNGVKDGLREVLHELESLVRTTVLSGTEPKVEPFSEDVFLVMYDLIASSNSDDDYQNARQRARLNAQVLPYAREHLGEVDCVPSGNDENAFIVKTATNALNVLERLLVCLEADGLCARIAVTSTVSRERLYVDRRYGIYSGQAFVVGARIRDYYKDQAWMGNGESHVFLDGIILRDLGLVPPGRLVRPMPEQPVRLRGAGLPDVTILEYVNVEEPTGRAGAAQLS